ncbi:MAG: DUF3108 domain-containing protein [Bacillota bacterium]|nr:DUF3108 domain-containing protein [Bacillota bacterium]
MGCALSSPARVAGLAAGLRVLLAVALPVAPFSNTIFAPEELVYRSRMEAGAPFTVYRDLARPEVREGRPVVRITCRAEDGSQTITMLLEGKGLRPLWVELVRPDGLLFSQVTYYEQEAHLVEKPGQKPRAVPITPQTYDQRSLFWALRGYPFARPATVHFDLLMPDGKRFRMYVRLAGEEVVTVPAGTFAAYKLEMGPADLPRFIAAGFLAYFWYSKEERPRFLRYEFTGIPGQVSEALSWSRGPDHREGGGGMAKEADRQN